MKQFQAVLVSAATSSLFTALILHAPVAVNAGAGGNGGQAQEPCTAQNGDVNADGKIDLTDPITILGHLFQGGPPLVPLCATAPAATGLPDTGQTKCYDQIGTEIPCDSETCAGQDGSYAAGCPSEERFVDNGDGTVTDNCSGLQWQKETADVNGDGLIKVDDFASWCDALAYCENLSLAGHDDWRLPNVRELQSIADYGRISPSIDPVFGAISFLYWSSTSNATYPYDAWLVHFSNGFVGGNSKANLNYVRAVRSGP
jgi:hypothetical protein